MVREKPFLEIDASGNYRVRVPRFVHAASASPGMSLPKQGEKTIPIAQLYIAPHRVTAKVTKFPYQSAYLLSTSASLPILCDYK